MKMPLNPNPLEARQPGSGVAPTQGAQGATGVGATAGDRRDLDLERWPSGKFATNALVLTLGGLAYNLLRILGQNGLLAHFSPVRIGPSGVA